MKKTTIILLTIVLGACGQQADEPAVSIYEAAVANEARPDADRGRDAGRRPAQVLEFFGIQPGMTVLDMFSGGGYYTEILAHAVGPDGHVIAQSNAAYLKFVGDEFEKRYLGGRLANVQVLMAENNELALEADSLDAIMLVLSFHDFFYAAPEDGWPEIDIAKLLAEFHSGLKASGVIGIIDHAAATGSPGETGGTTHRIDQAIVIETMAAAGFTVDGEIDILRNPNDDYEKIVFDPELRGKTDRFVLRFVKAE